MNARALSPLLLTFLFLAITACTTTPPPSPDATTADPNTTPIKNIILVIGDGMGPQQVGLLNDYARRAPNSIYNGRPSALETLASNGLLTLATTHSHDHLTVDSACSATHLATGHSAPLESIGLTKQGDPARTILEIARNKGMRTGLVSDTRITHATPASFAAHIRHRSLENDIALALLHTGVDVMLSGGLRHFLPRAIHTDDALRTHYLSQTGFDQLSSSRNDDRDLLAEAQAAGYRVATHRHQLSSASAPKLLGLFALSGMSDAIQAHRHRADPLRHEPTLREMSAAALRLLSASDDTHADNNPGFFLMIEAGQIDWAGHNNDAGTLLHELLRLDATLALLHQWVSARNDTLLIVTADHETGGFGFSYSSHQIPDPSPLPGSAFTNHPHHPHYNFGSLDVLDGLYQQSMSFDELFAHFDALNDPSPQSLQALVNQHSAFPITLDDAESILRRTPNRTFYPHHPYLSAETLPHVNDFHHFYVYGDEIRMDLLGRMLSPAQNIVWATGTHTHTPVPVIFFGPTTALPQSLNRFLHLTDVGQFMIDLLEPAP